MLLVFTANSNNSQEMTKELALASQQKLIVIPLRVEDVAPSEAFSYEFATRQWIDLFADWESAIDQLAQRIANAIADQAAKGGSTARVVSASLQADAGITDEPQPAPADEPEAAVAALAEEVANDESAAGRPPAWRRLVLVAGAATAAAAVAVLGLTLPGMLQPKPHAAPAMIAVAKLQPSPAAAPTPSAGPAATTPAAQPAKPADQADEAEAKPDPTPVRKAHKSARLAARDIPY